jgi:hypothetical protein
MPTGVLSSHNGIQFGNFNKLHNHHHATKYESVGESDPNLSANLQVQDANNITDNDHQLNKEH